MLILKYGQVAKPKHCFQFLTSETSFLLHLSLTAIVTSLDFVIADNVLLPNFRF